MNNQNIAQTISQTIPIRSRLNLNIPQEYRNLSEAERERRLNGLTEILHDRLGRPVEIQENLIERSDSEIIAVDQLAETARETVQNTGETILRLNSNLNPIINPSGWAEWFISVLLKFQDMPIFSKIILVGGMVVVIVTGSYAVYKIARRIPKTAVNPFGVNTDTNFFEKNYTE